jgi:hypothetical protein
VRALTGRFRSSAGQAAAGSGAAGRVPDALAVLAELNDRGVHLYHLYCEGDEGLDYFQVVLGRNLERVSRGKRSRFEVIAGANHVFTLLWSQEELVKRVCAWADELPVGVEPGTVGA